MTTVLTDNANYTAIANAIRTQLGVQTTYMPSEMAAAIASIEGGGGGGVVDPNHTYYNGYLLPTLPVVSGYDYVWIRRNEQTSTFDAVYGPSQWLAGGGGTPTIDNWGLGYNGITAGNYKYYTCSLSNPESWVENTGTSYTGFGTDNNRDIIWTSHDILYGVGGPVVLKAGLSVPHYTQSALGTKAITTNGTYNASSDNLDGYSQVTVNVPSSGGSRLPSGYTEVEYIEFSGGQFIHVTKTIIKNIFVYGKAHPFSSGEKSIIGCNTGNNWELYTDTYQYVRGYNYVSNFIETKLDEDTFPYIGRFSYSTYDSEFAIGCYYKPNVSPQSYLFAGYIYEITFVQWNGTINRWEDFLHFIPCTRDSDDEPGFYETVDGVFYTNDGSGSLIAGPTL